MAEGSFSIGFAGVVGATYRFDTSTNLSDWVTLGTVFLDANATKAPQRSYRAVWVP